MRTTMILMVRLSSCLLTLSICSGWLGAQTYRPQATAGAHQVLANASRMAVIDTSNSEGFTFDVGLGASVWGADESTCRCNATTLRVGAGFTTATKLGWGLGVSLEKTRALFDYLAPQLEASFYPALGPRGIRPVGLAVGYGRLVYLNPEGGFNGTSDHRGSTRFCEARFRAYLNQTRKLSVVAALGVGTLVERYASEGWNTIGDIQTRILNSGLRFRIGVEF